MGHHINQSISALMKSYRTEARQTPSDASGLLGVPVEQIMAWEEGKPIPLKRMAALVRQYKVQPVRFMHDLMEIQGRAMIRPGPEAPEPL